MKTLLNTDLDESRKDWPAFMQRAIDLASNALSTQPNPRVGCVLTNNGQVIGEGWHIAAGHPHAEIMALDNAKADTKGATAFVSLEPCCFQGKTGPCSEALIEAGVSQVVVAMLDPHPKVSGQGVQKLEAANIDVIHLSDFESLSHELNEGCIKRHKKEMPFVRLKLAMSLDGRTALQNGDSKWITGPAARADVQLLRAYSSAVITGIGTVLADDPRLDVRTEDMELSEAQLLSNTESLKRQPIRVVLDKELKTPIDAKILTASGKAVIYTNTHEPTSTFNPADDVEIHALNEEGGASEPGVHLPTVLKSLATDYECNDLLIEAGPTLSGAFIREKLVDELIVYIAPKLLGSDSKPLLQLEKIASLLDAPEFTIQSLRQIGNDIKVVLRAN